MENPFELILERLDRIEFLLIKQQENVQTKDEAVTNERLMNVESLAEYLMLSPATIYSMTHRKEVPYYKKNKRLYFRQSDIDNWINEGRSKSNDEIEKMAMEYIQKNPMRRR